MSENFSKGNFNMKFDSESNIEELEILIKVSMYWGKT